ncbi:MAG: hypothetical protein WDO18_06765 [Acidobacteriota bacterium]
MALAFVGRPNCALVMTVFHVLKTGVVKGVVGVDAQVGVQAIAPPERAAGGRIQRQLIRTGDRVAAGIAPLAGKRRGVRGWIQEETGRRGVGIASDVVRANRTADTGALHDAGRGGRQRISGGVIELRYESPLAGRTPRCGRW